MPDTLVQTLADQTCLEVSGLRTHFGEGPATVKAVNDISFTIGKGRVVGLVGESGSGKSMTGLSIMRLVESPGRIASGEIRLNGTSLLDLTEPEMRRVRGSSIAMIFQDPMMTLNPVLRIGTQMVEAVLAHRPGVRKPEARRIARDALARVGIPSPEERLDAYPHQFSGGMRQRVAIAIAIMNEPALIIADEPTTALDVTIQAQIIHQLQKLSAEEGLAILWITHDLSVVGSIADEILVMYAGQVVERGPTDRVLDFPLHPYTRGLIDSVPSEGIRRQMLKPVPGAMPPPWQLPAGCVFQNRCETPSARCDSRPGPFEATPGHFVSCFHPCRY